MASSSSRILRYSQLPLRVQVSIRQCLPRFQGKDIAEYFESAQILQSIFVKKELKLLCKTIRDYFRTSFHGEKEFSTDRHQQLVDKLEALIVHAISNSHLCHMSPSKKRKHPSTLSTKIQVSTLSQIVRELVQMGASEKDALEARAVCRSDDIPTLLSYIFDKHDAPATSASSKGAEGASDDHILAAVTTEELLRLEEKTDELVKAGVPRQDATFALEQANGNLALAQIIIEKQREDEMRQIEDSQRMQQEEMIAKKKAEESLKERGNFVTSSFCERSHLLSVKSTFTSFCQFVENLPISSEFRPLIFELRKMEREACRSYPLPAEKYFLLDVGPTLESMFAPTLPSAEQDFINTRRMGCLKGEVEKLRTMYNYTENGIPEIFQKFKESPGNFDLEVDGVEIVDHPVCGEARSCKDCPSSIVCFKR